MKKNLFCPNLSLPENKALVEKLGLFGFYKEYVKNNFNTPVLEDLADGTRSVQDYLYVNKDLFTAHQQDEVVDSIIFNIQKYRNEGVNNVNQIQTNILNDFKETIDYFSTEEFADVDEAVDLANSLKNVVANFKSFMKKANQKLASQDITVDSSLMDESNNEENTYDSSENLYQKLNYSDEASFKQSTKDTASANLKVTLSLIPKYVYENGEVVLDEDGNPETELSFINVPTFEALDTIWNDLLYTLYNVPIGEKLDYLSNSSNPRHRMIAKHIKENPNIEIRNQFETVFSKQMSKFVTINFSKADKTGAKSFLVFDTNRLNANSLLIDNWYESFLNSSAVTNNNGNLEINTTKGKELLDKYNNIKELLKTDFDKARLETKKLLSEIGIDISMKALESDKVRVSRTESLTVSDIINNKLGYFFNNLAGNTTTEDQIFEDSLEKNNPFLDENSTLELLAKLENNANPSFFEASFVSGDGKSKYAFVNNSYASLKVQDLKTNEAYLKQLKGTAYASGSYVLNKLINDPSFREVFDLYYLDSLGNSAVNQTNKTFTSMNTKEKELTKIAAYQNGGKGRTKATSDIGYYVGLVPSDKSTTPVFRSLKVDVKIADRFDTNGNYIFNQDAIEAMYGQFMSEYNRVSQTFKQLEEGIQNPIHEYHTGAQLGRRFIIFDFLNKVLIKEDKLTVLDDAELESLVKPELIKFMSNLTKDQVKYWKEIGVYPDNNTFQNFFDKGFSSKKGYRINKDSDPSLINNAANKFAAEYAVNNFIMMMNQTQLISGDPALHGKSVWQDKKKGIVEETGSINKTWINFYKRMAKDIAPGLDGNFSTDSFNTIFLKDLKYDSEHFMEYAEKIHGNFGDFYQGMNPADAQEYTTLDEHAEVMRAYGRLNAEAEAAIQRLKEGGSDANDLNLILNPMKPVYVNGQIKDGINIMYYIKSSSFPLIPALTKGLEIDKLRQVMEEKGIQRASYESAAKLGLQGDLNVPSKDGIEWNIIDVQPDQIINLKRSGFRIQQELPFHGDHTHINEGSQGRKLITNNLADGIPTQYNGKTYDSREVKEIFEKLHMEKMDRAMNTALSDLGFNQDLGRFEDITKVMDILKSEAESRNYPVNDLYAIQTIVENGKTVFKVPLSFTSNSGKFESILNSIITNRVIKSELPGFQSVQGASSGFTRIASDENLADSVIANSIIWVDPKDTKLNYITEKDGRLVSADILVPNYIKGINISDYVLEDGTLDVERLPADVRTVIGLRIPTQGYNSIMKFNVKGFLPKVMGDLAIVPAEVVVQMGSDFDVDKLFIYRYNTTIDKNGKVSKITADLPDSATEIDYASLSLEQIDNLIIQLFEDRLSDTRIFDQILEPNGFGNLPTVAKEISKLNNSGKAVHTFSTREQNSISDINVAGKMGTAVFSLFSTFFKASQDAKLSLALPYNFKNNKVEIVELNNISDLTNIEGDKRSNVIMYLQSAAVDNSKEQILGVLNINDYTMGVAGTMAMLGLDETFIGYFLSQPVIKEYVAEVSASNDIATGSFNIFASEQAIRNIEENLRAEVFNGDPLLEVLEQGILNKINYGTKELKEYLQSEVQENALTAQLTPEEKVSITNANKLFQFKIINNFKTFLELANTIQTLQSAMNVDTKGLGASYSAIEAKVNQIKTVLESKGSENNSILGIDLLFDNNTISKATSTLFQSKEVFGQLYSYGSSTYQTIIKDVLKQGNLSASDANLKDIYTNIKSFIMSNPELLNLQDLNVVRDSLLYGKENIAVRWLEYSKTPLGKKNILTKRIKPKVAKNTNDYNGVEALNTPASNNSADINNSIMYFYDMLNSTDAVERKLAEDLVKYFVVTGASFSPRSIGKYITYDVLEKYDFSKKLRDIDALMKNSSIFDGFTEQYFQNNPFKALSLDIEQIGGQIADVLSVPNNNSPIRNSNNDPVDYFQVYDAKNSTPVLYKRVKVEANHSIFEKIPVLGDKFIKKYNYLQGSTTIPAPVKEEVPNVFMKALNEAQSENVLEQRYGLNNVQTILDNIINKSNNDYFVRLATDLLKSDFSNVSFQLSTDRFANGWYTNNTVSINPELISKASDPLAKFEEVFLHELLHAGTVSMIDNYENLDNKSKIYVNRINRLFKEYSASKNQDELSRYIDLNDRRLNGEKLTQEEKDFLVNNKSSYYPLTDVREFIAAGLTNPDFTDTLKNNNLWTKLLDIIADLLGLNRNDLDFLYNSTIELVNSNQNVQDTRVSEDLFAPNDEYNRLEFVRQRDEFLRAHKTAIGKRITDDTLKKFQNSQASKDKYSRLKISSWNGELRVSRVDPVYEDIADTEIPKESAKDKVINDYINRLKTSLKRFNAKRRQLGDKADALIDNKISKLKEKIKSLEAERSISAFMSIAEDKIKEITNGIDDYVDVADVLEAKEYLNTLRVLNDRIAFTEEFEEWNNRLDSITAKAIKLNKRLKEKQASLLSNVIKRNIGIDYNISKSINKGLSDVGKFESGFLDGTQSTSKDIQAIEYLVSKYQMEANLEHDKFNEEFIPLIQEYKKKYGTDYSKLLQKDKNGKPTGFLLNKYSQDYYDTVKGSFKKFQANTDVSFTEDNRARWEVDKNHAFENLVAEDYLNWLKNNDPESYMADWAAGKNPTAKGAKRYLKILPKDKWIDKNYTALKALGDNDPSLKLYEFIEPIFRRNNKRYDQQANYIPEVQKTAVEEVLDGKFKNAIGSMKESFNELFEHDLVVDPKDIDIITGEPRLHVPVFMFSNELAADKKSYDLARIVEATVFQEITLKQKYQAEPVLNIYYALLKETGQHIKYDNEGNPITMDKPAARLLEQSNFIIQNYLYNKNRSLDNNEKLVGKAVDKVIDYTRLVGMGWNPFSAIGNITQGLTSNFIFADGRYFTKKEYTQASTIMLHSLAGRTTEAKKISSMFKVFDTFVKTNELNFGKSRELSSATQNKFKELVEPYNMQQRGEYFIQGQTMVGILLNTKLDTLEGNVSVYEAFNPDGSWNTKYGENPFDTSTKEGKNRLFKLQMKIRKAITDVHGNYNRPIQAKKDFVWRAAMMFRTWLPQSIHTRFGDTREDILTGDITKGRYRSFGSLFKDKDGKIDLDALKENAMWMIGLSKNTTLTELDKANMRRNIAELAMIVAITLAIAALKAGLEDLDDDEKTYVNYVLNTMSRSYNDLTFFMSYESFSTIIQDPIPLMRTIDNTADILPATWNYIIGEDEYKSGYREGQSKIGKEFRDLVPLITQIDKNWSYMQQTFD